MKIRTTLIQADKLILHDNHISGENFNFQPIYEKEIYKESDNAYLLKVNVRIESTRENPFPINVDVSFNAKFEFEEVEDQSLIANYLNIGAIQMMFPYIRSAITNLTTAALLPPLILPVVDVRTFIDATKTK
ncbi:protein-export chaperone SecB [Acholeplasma equirhinis]|uniref:protein-export chaperone SecB n=1 Tax=Acholeplasma equirhinis TaxID=555393 RepID=UPI00197A8F25|nr:protein-export chaperone SecB [Acholeplasma equirhinis]MBN3489953.1 protein-export chaperone SecB [Acholeplasma equirhinis]